MPDQAAAAATEIFDRDFFERASRCTVEAWLAFLGHRWNALVLYHLSLGEKRFGEISSCLPTLTPKVLTERLAALEQFGLIERVAAGTRTSAYALTSAGERLMPILNGLEVWARTGVLGASAAGEARGS